MKNCLKIVFFSLGWILCQHVASQSNDSLPQKRNVDKDLVTYEKKDSHSVKKAVIYSAILPGLGQAYNKKWWKMPLIYGALGTLGYFTVNNHLQHKAHVQEYLNRQDNPNYLIPDEFINLDDQALITVHRQYQNNRDLMIFGLIGVYAINLIDAAVDAHFFYFDITDDLTFHWQPQIHPHFSSININLQLKVPTKLTALKIPPGF